MDKDRQIEEIKKDIAPLLTAYVANTTGECWNGSVEDIEKVANRLIEKGYRKQIEGEWILTGTFKSTFPLPVADLHISCSVCGWKPPKYSDDYKEYNFCPNCGAKMKGEAE